MCKTGTALECVALFKEHSDLAGVVISLPNFGDEKSIAIVLREAKSMCRFWSMPSTITLIALTENRRDSFCGKVSVCNNLSAIWDQVHPDHSCTQ